MATTIFRVEKHKSFETMRSAGAHQFRFMNTPNADPEKFNLNKTLIGGNNIEKSAKALLEKYKVKPRKNAVLAMDGLIALSPEAIKSDKDVKRFADEATKFLKAKFNGRCISAVLHMDETSPHIHFTIIPIEKCPKKGYKLNARDQFSKSTLAQMQKDVFSHMHKAFPKLTPPQHGNKADHTKLKAYYNNIEAEADRIKKQMNDEIGAIRVGFIDDFKHKLAETFDGLIKAEFYQLRNKIGIDAYKLTQDFEGKSEGYKQDAFLAISAESTAVFNDLNSKVEAKIDEIRQEIEKPDSKFKAKPKRKSGMKM